MESNTTRDQLFQALIAKSTLKQDVYSNTLTSLRMFKRVIEDLTKDYTLKAEEVKSHRNVAFENRYRENLEGKMKPVKKTETKDARQYQ